MSPTPTTTTPATATPTTTTPTTTDVATATAAGFAPALAAEWMKLRSIRSTWWCLAGALALMLTVAPSVALTMANNMEAGGEPPGSTDLASVAIVATVYAAHFALGALGMLAVTGEYATRSIHATLACVPRRAHLLLAKAAVVFGVVLPAGTLIAAVGVAAGAPLLGDYADHDAGRTAAQVLAMGVHFALIAVLAVGLGTLIRRSAGTITVLFGLLLVVPMVLQLIGEATGVQLFATVADFTPTLAGERFMTGDVAFVLVVAAWSAASIAAGVRVLTVRDA